MGTALGLGVALGKLDSGGSGYTPTRFVKATGSDALDGLTDATAWQTITKVNSSAPAGATVAFKGGDTFSGTLAVVNGVSAGNPTIYTSYGTGRATISSGTASAVTATNPSNITIDGLNTTGAGILHGVYYQFTSGSKSGLTLKNMDITGHGGSGIYWQSTIAGCGATGFRIENVSAHACCGAKADSLGSAGVYLQPTNGDRPWINGLIHNCQTYSNPGIADGFWTGSGIIVDGGNAVVIQFCTAYNNSTLGSGAVGIWFATALNCTIQFCESYANKTTSGDGGGFDIDGGSSGCIIQYCYSHDNYGSGYMLYNYFDAALPAFATNTIRYCISENDAILSATTQPTYGAIKVWGDGDVSNCRVYNNVVYVSGAGRRCVSVRSASPYTVTATFANNIFYAAAGAEFILKFDNFGTATPTFQGNDYYATTTFNLNWNATAYTSFATWQTATAQEKISGANVGLTSNPQITTPGGGSAVSYKLLTGSPMRGVGQNILTLLGVSPGSRDYFGNGIPNTAGTGYNIGADGA